MEKGNKVLIKNTDSIWDGKRGTVISEEDDIVTVKINFETEDGVQSVIQDFNKENLEMERENESLNEDTVKEIETDQAYSVLLDGEQRFSGTKEDCERFVNDNSAPVGHEWEIVDNAKVLGSVKDEENECLNEDLNVKNTNKEDIIHQYIYLEDLDGNEVPSWNFAARIATAEDIDEGCVCELAHDLGYKVFFVEAPGFFKEVIAAKGVKPEDIQEEYADFLQGRSHVRECEW